MLEGIRKAGEGLLGRIVITILFGFLIISFGIWGVGDMIRGSSDNSVATIGSTKISPDTLRNAYQSEIQQLTRRFRQPISPERARAMGIDAQVFGRLVTEAALAENAKQLKLGISDTAIAQTITNDPTFKDASGKFDRALFENLLRSNGLTESAFVKDQRQTMLRQQIAEAVAGGVQVPQTMAETIYRYGAERRAASYFVLPASAAGDIPTPDQKTLQTYFDTHKSAFRAPEYRKLSLLVLTPETLAKPQDVSEKDAREHYEKIKLAKFGTPEKRTIEQIPFKTEADAKAAADKVKAGATFADIAKAQGLSDSDIKLGTFAKTGIFDPAVRDAAFALKDGEVSAPVQSQFGPVLLHVTKIDPQSVKPYDAVADEVKKDLALKIASDKLAEIHDKIEDQRAAAKALAEIAPSLGLSVRNIPAVDNSGKDKDGKPVDVGPDQSAVLQAAFAANIGDDTEAVRLRTGGYVWYEVNGVDPAHDRKLDEVKDKVAAQWHDDEVAKRLAEKSKDIVRKIDGGEDFAKAASDAGQSVKTADGLARNATKDVLKANAISDIFGTNVGKSGSAALDGGLQRVVFRVTSATLAPFDASLPQAGQLKEQLQSAVQDDLLTQYVAKLENDLGVKVNQQALQTALGTGNAY